MDRFFIYKVKNGETLVSIAKKFGISVEELRNYHNLWCKNLNDQIAYTINEGKEIVIEHAEIRENREKEKLLQEKSRVEKEQEDKYFIVDGSQCSCNKGNKIATLKVISHSKVVFNSNQSDKWVATEEDVHFKEGTSCFGICSINNNPCYFSPTGKWQNVYNKLKILDKATIIENSYIMCSMGGKITIKNHGQISEISNRHIQKADTFLINMICPMIDFGEIQEEQDENQYYI